MNKHLLSICLGSLLLAGCHSVNSIERAEPLATPNPIAIKKVITDPALERKVSIHSVNETTVSDDLLKIQLQLENLTYELQDFYYQFVWIDKDGFVITSPTPLWHVSQLKWRETNVIIGIAPNPNVVDFQVKLLSKKAYDSGVRNVPRARPAGKH